MWCINGTIKRICIGVFIGLFASVLSAQESDILPFAYVTQAIQPDGKIGNYTAQVVDVASGDILFTADSETMSCALSASPDGQWLVYESLASPTSYILHNIPHDADIILSDKRTSSVRWGDNLLYFMTSERQDSGDMSITLRQYDLIDGTVDDIRIAESTTGNNPIRWFNDDFALITLEKTQFVVYRNDIAGLRFLLPVEDFVQYIQLSATTRYFSASFRQGGAIIIDTDNGDRLMINTQANLSWYHQTDAVAYIDEDIKIAVQQMDSGVVEKFDVLDDVIQIREVYISPDDRYIAYINLDESNTEGFSILDTTTGDVLTFGQNNPNVARVAYPLVWVDDTHLVYINPSAEALNTAEDSATQDLWVYNTTTQQSTQVTNTPDYKESFVCVRG